jgi:hypothetical protein
MSITRIEVDFNDRDDSGLIPASTADADGHLVRGAWVDAFDDEGYRCLATVGSLHAESVTLIPNWNTFTEPNESRLIAPGADYQGPLTVSFFPAHLARSRRRSAQTA